MSSSPPSSRLRWLRTALLAVVVAELSAYAVIVLTRSLMDLPIQRRAAVYAAQSDAITRMMADDPGQMFVIDSTLGWTNRPGYEGEWSRHNALGMRAQTEYGLESKEGVTRVAVLGNSFSYGAEVDHGQSFPARLDALDPALEVLNFSVAAYGMDQCLIQYTERIRPYQPDVVVVGVAPDNVRRLLSVWRRFLTPRGAPQTKPRFTLAADDSLVFHENRVRSPADLERYLADPSAITELGEHDGWYEPLLYSTPLYDWSATVRVVTNVWVRVRNRFFDPDPLYRGDEFNPESTALRLEVALIERLVGEIDADGALPVVAFMPDREAVERAVRGQSPSYAPIRDALDERGIGWIDLTHALVGDSGASLNDVFTRGGHYSAEANARVAEMLHDHIRHHDQGGP